MKGDEEEASPFKRSGKVARSPVGVPPAGGSESENVTKKRKERSGKTPEKSMEKRSRPSPVQSASEMTETESEDVATGEASETEGMNSEIGLIWQATSEIKHWLSNQYKSKRISLLSFDEINRKIRKIRQVSNLLVVKNAKLEGRIEEREKMEDIVEKKLEEMRVAPIRKTFAEAVTIPKISGIRRVAPSPKILMIQSREEGKEPDEVKKILKDSIKPGEMGINVRRVRKTARGVMIEMENEEQVKRVEQSVELARKGLMVERLKKKNPRVMIYDVEDDVLEDDMVRSIYEQNLSGGEVTLEMMQNEFKCVHKFKHKTDLMRKHWVVECSARVRNELRKKDRVYVGWQSCRLKDYNPLVRCYNCQAFGHVSKFCRNKAVCPHCSGEHGRDKCVNREKPGICVNCKYAGKSHDHETGDRDCPEMERASRLAIERIDYGN